MSELQDSQLDRAKERRAMAWLLVPCALLALTGLVIGVDGAPEVTPVTLGDVSDATVVEIRDAEGVTVLSGEFRSRTDSLGNTEKDAALLDRRGRRVIGEVELEIPAPDRADRRPELEVDILELAPNATFTVVIDDTPVGRFTTDDRGSVDVEIQEGELPLAPMPGI
jgi:hypothetical protein